MEPLVLEPSKFAKIGVPLFEAGFGGILVVLARPWRYPALERSAWWVIAIGTFLFFSAIEFSRRRVVIHGDVLMERLWFHWRVRALPASVLVGRDSRRRVVIADGTTRKILFRFVREFGQPKQLEARIAAHLSEVGRLA
jgi:hypothetical protein